MFRSISQNFGMGHGEGRYSLTGSNDGSDVISSNAGSGGSDFKEDH